MNSHRSILQVLLAILGLAGIILIPLPFTGGETPLSHVRGGFFKIWQLGLPFFLAFLATLFVFRWIISGRLSGIESAVGYFAGVVSALVTISLYLPIFEVLIDSLPGNIQEWAGILLPLVTLIAGGYMVYRNWRKGLPHGLNAWVWVQVAYLANCLFCLCFFMEDLQVGAYLALITAIVYGIQIILIERGTVP